MSPRSVPSSDGPRGPPTPDSLLLLREGGVVSDEGTQAPQPCKRFGEDDGPVQVDPCHVRVDDPGGVAPEAGPGKPVEGTGTVVDGPLRRTPSTENDLLHLSFSLFSSLADRFVAPVSEDGSSPPPGNRVPVWVGSSVTTLDGWERRPCGPRRCTRTDPEQEGSTPLPEESQGKPTCVSGSRTATHTKTQ